VEGTIDALAHKADEKRLEMAYLIHRDVPSFLRGDPGRLRQVLTNLIGNAFKFTETGEVVVRVQLEETLDKRARIRFDITDTGIGIPPDRLEHIFEKFTQVDGSTTRKYNGAGLGLSISRQLLERMDGEIGVESKEGKGSRFWFVVPFDLQDVEQTQPEWRMPEIYGMRMLVVDDNKTNRTILVKILESFGCEPAAVATGAKGIEALVDAARSGNPYKIVFLDNYMPGMGGEQTAREIKANTEISDVEIVMLTSAKRRGDVSRFDAIGCAGYLVKPVKQSQLFDTIVTVLCIGKSRKTKKTTIVTRDTTMLSRIQKANILLVEDNPVNQKLAAKLLEKVGLHCVVADNGEDALKALSRDRYDLVLMDIQMPVMNGFEATRAIREREGSEHHTPIIAMTAHAMQGDREKCLEAGMDDYLSKPLNRKEMFSVIEKWVKASLADSRTAREKASSEIGASRNSPIDLDSALERTGGDREFLNELIETFLEHTPEQINLLAGAAQKGDAESVAESAHSIKGSAGNLSADSIASLAEVIEKMARSGDISTISPILEKLKDEMKRFTKHFQAAKQGATQ